MIYNILLIIVSIGIIVLTLLQNGSSNGLSGFTGKNDLKLFEDTKERGSDKVLTIITAVFAVIFFVMIYGQRFIK